MFSFDGYDRGYGAEGGHDGLEFTDLAVLDVVVADGHAHSII
jgi:hypothetical protein